MRTAAYARYSSDQQRDASLEDQLRNCRAFCARHGWPDPIPYTDAAMSGSRGDRPGYQRLLADAQSFDVILLDDLSRLSRDSGECSAAVKRLKFAGVRLIGVSDGVDTQSKGYKTNVGLRGLMGELYLDDLAEKTHRGLTGRALAGASAGGLPYGYAVTVTGARAILPAQAAVVRRIFAEYVAGHSPREIAATLNQEGVRSARDSTWCMSAIHGDLRRGIGILANPIYAGRQVWNRSRWVKHPDTGKRVRQERPSSEWITTNNPALAIIDADTWEAAQARAMGHKRHSRPNQMSGAGRPPKHILSGILRCDECGGPMTVVDRYRYGCAAHKDRGDAICGSRLRVPRLEAEKALLAGVRDKLLSEEAFQQFQRFAAETLKDSAPDLAGAEGRVSAAERVRENMAAALRAGIITPTTRAELLAAESELDAARKSLMTLRQHQPAQMLPRARAEWRRMAAAIEAVEDVRNAPEGRAALRELLGSGIVLREEAGAVYAEIGASKISVVAGAGFEPATFGL